MPNAAEQVLDRPWDDALVELLLQGQFQDQLLDLFGDLGEWIIQLVPRVGPQVVLRSGHAESFAGTGLSVRQHGHIVALGSHTGGLVYTHVSVCVGASSLSSPS